VPPKLGARGKNDVKSERFGGALLAVLVTGIAAVGLSWLSTDVFERYGSELFLLMPCICGALAALIHGAWTPATLGNSLGTAALSGVFAMPVFLLLGQEGAICLAMALPVMLPLYLIGGLIGHGFGRLCQSGRQRGVTGLLLALLAPLMMGLSTQREPSAPLRAVVSRVVINASRADVWREVIQFSPIPAATEWYFRAGIAHPLRARIEGHGVGAIRYCEFTTGDFVEPITDWQEGRRLAFEVAEQPDPMIEISPYGLIHPPHLDWAVRSERGEFLLTELPDGRCELQGTTWVRTFMGPQLYWSTLVEACIHRIHLRVLNHIKDQVEPTPAVHRPRETTRNQAG